jgi:hypothetical protein
MDLARNVPTDLMQQIVADNRSRPSTGGSMLPQNKVVPVGAGKVSTPDIGPKYRRYEEPPTEETADRSGWREGRALRPPDGVREVDLLCDQADLLDRAERIAKLVEAAKNLQVLKEAEAEAKKLAEKDEPK